MTFQILGAVRTVATNWTQMSLFAVVLSVVILNAVVGLIADIALMAPKRLFEWMAICKVSCQFVSGGGTLATQPTHHRNGRPIAKINPLLWFFPTDRMIFDQVMILFSMTPQSIRCTCLVITVRTFQILEIQMSDTDMSF